MSSRAGWTYNGKHFTETCTERGGLRYFIDGKPTAKRVWQAELRAAKAAANKIVSLGSEANPPVTPEG
jgi:hypothetical protein